MSNVALVDVRHIDGEPWDVAQTAGKQYKASLDLTKEALDGLWWAARGAWLSQEHHRTGKMPSAEEWTVSPLARKLLKSTTDLTNLSKDAYAIHVSASYDPRSV